ncbi:putative high-mobility group non-histone chromosomal protein, partial [Ramicandelaber brevisporus]
MARTARTPRKTKDPNAPKRPLSAYLIFTGDKRGSIQAENPDIKQKDIMKKLGEMWSQMSDAEKEPYNAQAKKAK